MSHWRRRLRGIVLVAICSSSCAPLGTPPTFGYSTIGQPRAVDPRRDVAPPQTLVAFQVEIISDPPGAHIEVNNEYVGDCPVTITINGYADRTFAGYPRGTTIRALPTEDGHYTQSKWFYPGGYPSSASPFIQGDKIPERLFFDMRLGPARPAQPSAMAAPTEAAAPAPQAVEQQLLLFGGENHDVFLGCITCSSYDANSIWSSFGSYGSKYTETSIWNRYGKFGSKFSAYSPWNRFGSSPPTIVDAAGGFYGYFTVNRFQPNRTTLDALRWILDNADYVQENLDDLRSAMR